MLKPVMTFSLTDDTIYYAPFKLRHLYVPDDYENNPEKVTFCLLDERRCGIDGKNIRKVYTNDTLIMPNFIVVGGIIYGWMFDYGEETHHFQEHFRAIDMENDRIIRRQSQNN